MNKMNKQQKWNKNKSHLSLHPGLLGSEVDRKHWLAPQLGCMLPLLSLTLPWLGCLLKGQATGTVFLAHYFLHGNCDGFSWLSGSQWWKSWVPMELLWLLHNIGDSFLQSLDLAEVLELCPQPHGDAVSSSFLLRDPLPPPTLHPWDIAQLTAPQTFLLCGPHLPDRKH